MYYYKYTLKNEVYMKINKRKITAQKRIMQQKIDLFSKLNEPMPPSGWVKAIRGSLGMTIRQLADRVGVGHGSITQLEKREPQKKVTLESLDKAAKAMDCKVIYAIVPLNSENSIDKIIQNRAQDAAFKILKDVSHSMRLEKQGTTEKQILKEIDRVAKELIDSNDPRIWGKNNKKVKRPSNG